MSPFIPSRITNLLYKPWLNSVKDIYSKALKLNEGEHFNFPIMREGLVSYNNTHVIKPNAKTQEFLDEALVELYPVLNEKAVVEAYLLRCANRIPSEASKNIMHLMPKAFWELESRSSFIVPNLTEKTEIIIEEFKQMPEQALIKKRLFLRSMYVC